MANISWYVDIAPPSPYPSSSALTPVQPNDEQEQDRLDLSHHIYKMLFHGDLQRAPITNPRRVLAIGTGTGIWVIDFAE